MEEISQDEYVAEIKRRQAAVQESADFWHPAITGEHPVVPVELSREEQIAARFQAVQEMTPEQAHEAVLGNQARTAAGHPVAATSGRIPPRETNWV